MAMVPTVSGMPTTANSKKPKGCSPAATAASDTMTLIGVPVRASRDPALPGEGQWHHPATRRPTGAHREHHDHGEQRGDRAVERDQRRHDGAEQEHENEQQPRSVAGNRRPTAAPPTP